MSIVSRAAHWLSRNRREAAAMALLVLLAVGMLVLTHRWWAEIVAFLQGTHAFVFIVLMCTLPLAGVSITLVYVVVGARFGGGLGLALIAVATAVHLLGTHLIARSVLRAPVERMLRRRDYRLPAYARDEPVALALLGALVPGLPYLVRNYLLALSGIPFRIYFLVCWPIYVVRSGVAIVLGDWAQDLSATRIAILAGVFGLKVSICALVVGYLHRKHHGAASRPPAGKRRREARAT